MNFCLCCTLGVLRCYKDTLCFVLSASWLSLTMRTFISLRFIFTYGRKKESSFILFHFILFYELVSPKSPIKQFILFLIFLEHFLLYVRFPQAHSESIFLSFIKSYNLHMVKYIHLKYTLWWILTDVRTYETTTAKIERVFYLPKTWGPFAFYPFLCLQAL